MSAPCKERHFAVLSDGTVFRDKGQCCGLSGGLNTEAVLGGRLGGLFGEWDPGEQSGVSVDDTCNHLDVRDEFWDFFFEGFEGEAG